MKSILKGTVFLKTIMMLTFLPLVGGLSAPLYAGDEVGTVRIGVLHSLSGTMAISETSLHDVVLMAVKEINAAGGVLGKKIEPVVADPASDWDLFAVKAKELIVSEKVAVVFGCWTSVSRKHVLPVFEKYNGLLFTRCNTKARSRVRTLFIPVPLRISS